jgi:hypothetical protein
MNSGTFYMSFAAAIAIACGLQVFLYFQEFYSISWDESGRTLDAYRWTLDKDLLKATTWLPFYRVIVGLGLEIFPDLFVTPRIVSFIFGMGSLFSVTWLSYELFHSKQITLLTAFLGACFSQRVALSLAPLSCIMFICMILISMAFFVRWVFSANLRELFSSAAVLAIAGTIRYEGWVFAVCFLLIVSASSVADKNRIPTKTMGLVALVLAAFPLFWLTLHALRAGNPLGILASGTTTPYSSLGIVLRKNPFTEFIIHNTLTVNLVGLISAINLVKNDTRFRQLLLGPGGSLLLISAFLLLSGSAQSGPSWRMTGVWSILLIPFTAHFLLSQERRFSTSKGKRLCTYGLMLVTFVMFLLHIGKIKKDSHWAFPRSERAAGQYLNDLLVSHPRTKILIESSGFFYLNIMIASQHPNVFVLNSIPEQPHKQESIISPEKPIDESALTNMGIGILVFKTREYKDRFKQNSNLAKREDFGDWSIYQRGSS